jgi:transcriptional regulator with XRE-family HTH domain
MSQSERQRLTGASAQRQETVEIFRRRLNQVIEESRLSRSAFAKKMGLDRSTLFQLLAESNSRLPRMETVAAIARNAQLSVDWLLGLSQAGQAETAELTQTLEIAYEAGDPADERLASWHAEALGYKIRYVPSTLPDLLKTDSVIEYEYLRRGVLAPDKQKREADRRLAYSRRPETDMEVCTSFQYLKDFAFGNGIWDQLPVDERREQLRTIHRLAAELYPTFRWFLFDGLENYAAPMTVFGPKRAALFIGGIYLVFTGTEHIRTLTRQFDNLIRSAVVQPPDLPAYVGELIERMEETPERKTSDGG